MSTLSAIGYPTGVLLAAAVILWAIRRTPKTTEQQRVDAARARVGLVPPVVETAPGRNIADLDECQLILGTPYPDLEAGLARLLADIRNEQAREAGDA